MSIPNASPPRLLRLFRTMHWEIDLGILNLLFIWKKNEVHKTFIEEIMKRDFSPVTRQVVHSTIAPFVFYIFHMLYLLWKSISVPSLHFKMKKKHAFYEKISQRTHEKLRFDKTDGFSRRRAYRLSQSSLPARYLVLRSSDLTRPTASQRRW